MAKYIAFKFDEEYQNETRKDRIARLDQKIRNKIETYLIQVREQLPQLNQITSTQDPTDDALVPTAAQLTSYIAQMEALSNKVSRSYNDLLLFFITQNKQDKLIEVLARMNVALEDPTNSENNQNLQILIEQNSKVYAFLHDIYAVGGAYIIILAMVVTLIMLHSSLPIGLAALVGVGFGLLAVANIAVNAAMSVFETKLHNIKNDVNATKVSDGETVSFFKPTIEEISERDDKTDKGDIELTTFPK